MLFAEWYAYLGVTARKEDVAGYAGGTRTAHDADQRLMGSLVQCLDLGGAYLKKRSSLTVLLTLKYCLPLQKLTILLRSGSLQSLNSFMKPSLPN